jgi:hypothetical protein
MADGGSAGRLAGWQERLAAWAQRRLGDPFQWGESDCAIVCCEAFDCLTGSRMAAEYRARYHNARQALRFQAKRGINLQTELERRGAFRWQGMALFGDLILHPHPEEPWMVGHVVIGPELVLSANEAAGVCCGRIADAVAQPGAGVWRVT